MTRVTQQSFYVSCFQLTIVNQQDAMLKLIQHDTRVTQQLCYVK